MLRAREDLVCDCVSGGVEERLVCYSNTSRTHLHSWFSILPLHPAGPEEMGAGGHSAALVWLLEEAGGAAGAVGAQGLMVLLSQALHPLECSHNQE